MTSEPSRDAAVVRDNPVHCRYEISLAGRNVGLASYRLAAGARVFVHTEIRPEFQRLGLGTETVRGALADVRAQGLKAIALCPFVSDYVAKHPEDADLIAADVAAR